MNVEIRNINGVRGFCIYKGGVPYTYIYTRDAIGMLGLSRIQNNIRKLRIDTFGEHFIQVINGPLPEGINSSECGVNISSQNYKISQDSNFSGPTGWTTENTGYKIVNESKYDSILPEFTLDRIIFAIANKLHNKTAEEFRLQLIWNIIPHFQQTATQEQISKVPILNTTSQFMYDNSNIKFVTQQAYNFNQQVIFSHVNRFAILTEETNLDVVFEKLFNGFQDALHETDINIYDEVMRVVEVRKSVNPYRTPEITKQDIIDTLICNVRLHNLFINFVSICIREVEKQILLKQNGQAIKQKWNEETGYDDDVVEYDDGLKHPVEFTSLDERAGQNPLQEETLKDYIPNTKRDTSWIY